MPSVLVASRTPVVSSGSHPSLPPFQLACLQDLAEASDRLEAIAERTGGTVMHDAERRVAQILEQVRQDGDQALIELTERFDGVRPEPLRIPPERLAAAWDATPSPLQQALARRRANRTAH